jgi:cytochrome c biogenesis protein CcmG/thiol:disulfide interchange protein DsbE
MDLPPPDPRSAAPASTGGVVTGAPGRGRGRPGAWVLVVAAIVAVAAVALVVDHRSSGSGAAGAAATPAHLVGHPLPDATFTTFDGATSDLAALAGKPTVINFWSATCVPCRTEMPALERLHRARGTSVTFLGIDSGDGTTTATDAARQSGVTYSLALDPQSRVAARLGAVALPTTVVVAADGTVTHVHVGAVDPAQLSRWIDQA